jgi:hypothetical protein
VNKVFSPVTVGVSTPTLLIHTVRDHPKQSLLHMPYQLDNDEIELLISLFEAHRSQAETLTVSLELLNLRLKQSLSSNDAVSIIYYYISIQTQAFFDR